VFYNRIQEIIAYSKNFKNVFFIKAKIYYKAICDKKFKKQKKEILNIFFPNKKAFKSMKTFD